MKEKRDSVRQRALKRGTIAYDGGKSRVDCIVADLSRQGSRLLVELAAGVPEQFALLIETPISTQRRECRVVRRRHNEIGVAFI